MKTLPLILSLLVLVPLARATPPPIYTSTTNAAGVIEVRGEHGVLTFTLDPRTPPAPPPLPAPMPAPLPTSFTLEAVPVDPSQLTAETTVFVQMATVVGGVTNAFVAFTNYPGNNLTWLLQNVPTEKAFFRTYESNALYGLGEFSPPFVKPAAPLPRTLQLRR